MRGTTFQSGLNAFLNMHARLDGQRQVERAQRRAREAEEYMRTARPSGALGDGRLAVLADLEQADLFDTNGLFIGAHNGRMLFYNGDSSLLTYLPTGGGKGTSYLLPNLAHCRGQSLFVVDVKPELAWATIDHRLSLPGHKVVVFDPFNTMPARYPKVQVNPLYGLIDVIQRGDIIETEAEEIAEILLPAPAKRSGNDWVRDGAIRTLSLRMEYLAQLDPENTNLSSLWRFVNCSDADFDLALKMMETCGVSGIEGRAGALRSMWREAAKQWEAIKSECQKAVSSYEPGKALARHTSQHTYSFAEMKRVPTTVYVLVPSDKLTVAAPWISMLTNYAIEAVARAHGPVRTTLMLDEFPQLPPCGAILKTLRLYRGMGVRLWPFAQGRKSMEAKWSPEAVLEFEEQVAILTMGNVRQSGMIKDIMLWSGKTTIIGRGKSHNGGKIETSGDSVSETSRDVLQPEDILRLQGDKQIIRIAGVGHLLVCDKVPYFTVTPWKSQIRDVRKLHSGELGWD